MSIEVDHENIGELSGINLRYGFNKEIAKLDYDDIRT